MIIAENDFVSFEVCHLFSVSGLSVLSLHDMYFQGSVVGL